MTTRVEQPLTTVDGKFYVGMKAQEAKDKDLFSSSIWHASFEEIDQNSDGELSGKEICDRRDKECNNEKVIGYLGLGMLALGATALVVFSGGTAAMAGGAAAGVATSDFMTGVAGAAIAGTSFNKVNEEQEITVKYKEQHPEQFGL